MPRSKKTGAVWANTRLYPLSRTVLNPRRFGDVCLADLSDRSEPMPTTPTQPSSRTASGGHSGA